MTATKQFALDAQQGGYPTHLIPETVEHYLYADEKMLLDAKAWQAVGKTRGWGVSVYPLLEWEAQWHRFIQNLADGQSIEEALTSIST